MFISLASLYGGVLNSIDRFAEVAFTPVLLNLALIGAVLGLTPLLPDCGLRRLDRRGDRGPPAMAVAAVLLLRATASA